MPIPSEADTSIETFARFCSVPVDPTSQSPGHHLSYETLYSRARHQRRAVDLFVVNPESVLIGTAVNTLERSSELGEMLCDICL